jgi:hypothetical protein
MSNFRASPTLRKVFETAEACPREANPGDARESVGELADK